MRMDKLTTKFQMALADAQSLAIGRDNQFIEPAHVMQALLEQDNGSTEPLLMQAGVNVAKLRDDLNKTLDTLAQVKGTGGDVHISNDLNKILNLTDKLEQEHKDQFISSEFFILAAVDESGTLGKIKNSLEIN